MTRVLYIRHGQTLWNATGKYQGHSDIPLSNSGIEQAQKVARRLRSEKLSAVYSSDLQRACLTAETIAGFHKLVVNKEKALREIHFGDWEGLSYEEINLRWPGKMDVFFNQATQITLPGGENFKQVEGRASEFIRKIVEQHFDQTVAVVAHGGVIATLLSVALKISLDDVWNIRLDNTSVSIVEYYQGGQRVSLMNDAHHLNIVY